jgi:glycosyltransferase involved in cell wall biosynthesis/GT2 family glycosyltransferase
MSDRAAVLAPPDGTSAPASIGYGSGASAAADWLSVFADAVTFYARRRTPVLTAPVSPAPSVADAADAALVRESGLFDRSFYLCQLPAPLPLRGDPLAHYLATGWREGRDPNPLFSVDFYLYCDPALAAAGIEPLGHYLRSGAAEGRDPHPLFSAAHYGVSRRGGSLGDFLSDPEAPSPHPLFDPAWYARHAGLPRASAPLALLHYLVTGWRRGLAFSPLFNAAYYRSQWPEGAVVTEPYGHYRRHGVPNGLDPHPMFDVAHYRRQRPCGAGQAADPLVDFITAGEAEGAPPSVFFDTAFYNARYRPGRGRAGALLHFLTEGRADARPRPDFASANYRQVFMKGLDAADGPTAIEHFLTQGGAHPMRPRLAELLAAEAAEPPPCRADDALPAPCVTQRLADSLRFRHYPGKRAYLPGRPHVLLVAHAAGDFLFGSERSFVDMLEGLALLPANVVVALPRQAPAYTNELRTRCQHVCVFDYKWWRKGESEQADVTAVFAELIASLHIDAVHANTIMLRECLTAARACGIPGIVHAREMITSDEALLALIGEPASDIVAAVCARADWIIGNSVATAEIFAKPGRSFVIPNTVDIAAFAMGNPVETAKIRFGLISSNIPKKGLEDVVALARLAETSCPRAEFLLIGPESDAVRDIQRRQAEGTVSRTLLFPGYAASPMAAVAQVQVVLNFSHFAESFGRTVLEAMAAGRPVIAYAWGALPELVRHGVNGYLIPFKEPQAALPFVEAFCASPRRITELGEAGRRIAREQYGLEQYGALFRKAYASILPATVTAPVGAAAPVVRHARRPGLKNVEAPARIAYVCWHFPVPSETFVLSELERLVRDGSDVMVFCRQSPHRDFAPSFDIRYERVDSVATLARRLVETGRTIVHAHFVYPTVTDLVWPACEAAGLDFTFIAHAQDVFRYENDRRNRLAEIGASPRCRKLFTLSRFHADYVAERGFPPDKIVINPNAVDTGRFAAASVAGREDRAFRRVIAIHRFVAKKGLSLLVRAAALLRDLDISIEIYGYGDCEAEYRALIGELGLRNVTIGGRLTQEEVLAIMRTADLFVCPSVRAADGDMDGIPTSLVESMAAGLPVLATRIAGIPELIADGITGLLAEADPAGLALAIRRFYAMPAAAVRAMTEAARRRVMLRHDAVRAVRVLMRVWENRTTDIVVVSWNNLAELRAVIARILANTALPYHLIICDNHSEREPVPAWLDTLWETHDRVTVVHNDRNAMVGPGTNLALAQGCSDIAIYICGKEGYSFVSGWETAFIHAFADNPKAGLAGTIGHSPSYLTGAQYPKGIGLFGKFRNQYFAARNPRRQFGHVQGGLFGMRRAMVEQIGGFSDSVPHDYTDVEYSYYAESRGWALADAPGVLALFNKSRPTLSQRFEESIVAAHPVLPDDVEKFDGVQAGRLKHCNMCDWFGESFTPEATCPACASRPEDRTLYRWLGESPYMYRRLTALAAGLGGSMEKLWTAQFQGPHLPMSGLVEQLRRDGRLRNGSGVLHLAVLRVGASDDAAFAMLAKEIRRLLKSGSVALFQGEAAATGWYRVRAPLTQAMRSVGFFPRPDVTYASEAVQFAHEPMLAFADSEA